MTVVYALLAWLVASFPLAILVGRCFARAGVSVDADVLSPRVVRTPPSFVPTSGGQSTRARR